MHDRIVLHAEPGSVGAARRWCARTLEEWGASGDVVDSACLVVSELVTNAVLHAGTSCELTVQVPPEVDGDVVRIEVADGDPGVPVAKRYDVDAASGRGLHLVEALSDRYGTRPLGAGKAVWCELAWESSR
jgi:anti-sigma regulatory factor (Ser/Thr protein kinase)